MSSRNRNAAPNAQTPPVAPVAQLAPAVQKTQGFPKSGLEAFKSGIENGYYTCHDIVQSSQPNSQGVLGHHCELRDDAGKPVGRATAGQILLQQEWAELILAFEITIGDRTLTAADEQTYNIYKASDKTESFTYGLRDGSEIYFERKESK